MTLGYLYVLVTMGLISALLGAICDQNFRIIAFFTVLGLVLFILGTHPELWINQVERLASIKLF